VTFFGAVPRGEAVLVSVSGSSQALPGTDAGSVKVTRFAEYPAKGRGTAGVRCHRFLKGEDCLLLAWAGPTPAVAAAASGSPVELPAADNRRDGSGVGLGQPLAAVSSRSH
jgi:DNA gyrase subunit A